MFWDDEESKRPDMIHVINFTGHRDLKLAEAMEQMLRKNFVEENGTAEIKWTRVWCDDTEWGNGAGWEASMMKIRELRKIEVPDNDYLLSVDSDVLFFTPEVFYFVNQHKAGIMGIQNVITVETVIGPLNHMGGCCTFIRGDILKEINSFTDAQLTHIRNQFKHVVLCENEDVVVSYLAKIAGADFLGFPPALWSGGIEQDLLEGTPKSFYHVNYSPTQFLGVPVTGKWDIPEVLKSKNLL